MHNSEKNWLFRHLKLIIVIVIVLVLAILIFLALRGKTTITGEYPASIKTNSIVCTKSNYIYPYTEGDKLSEPTSRNIRIVGTFDESKNADKISLDYTVTYDNESTASKNEPFLHGNFGKKIQEDGFPHSELNNNFSIVGNKVILSLYTTAKDLNAKNAPYLLLPTHADSDQYKITLDEFKQTFVKNKFECISTN